MREFALFLAEIIFLIQAFALINAAKAGSGLDLNIPDKKYSVNGGSVSTIGI